MSPSDYLAPLEEAFRKMGNPERGAQMQAYMRDLYPYYGIQAKPRADLLKKYLRDAGFPENVESVVQECWEREEREWQYAGLEIADRAHRKGLLEQPMELFRFMIISKSGWDTVDSVASNGVGRAMKEAADFRPVMEDWLYSGNLWLQRSCLIFQLKYKSDTDISWLHQSISELKGNKEFFIQKAIGWALRQHARIDAEWVRREVDQQKLQGIARREALKHIGA